MQAAQNSDYYAWTLETAERLRTGRLSEVDLNGVAQELEDMGKAQRHALGGYLKVLIVHLLKWRYQPSFSWCELAAVDHRRARRERRASGGQPEPEDQDR